MPLFFKGPSTAIMQELRQLGLTFAIALATGWLFLQLRMPAPYLMGSLFGVWIIGGVIKPLQPHLGVARWFHIPVILGLGVLIGANFTADIVTRAGDWHITIAIMIGTTILVSAIGYVFLTKRRGYESKLAFLCCIPGGQAEALALARDLVDKDYVVALFHLVRVVIVFISTPLLLALVQGSAAVDQSNAALLAMPSITDLAHIELIAFIGIAILGYFAAKVLRIPMPHLIGTMGLSTILHMMGWVELPRVNEFVMLAQLAIGGAVGARLAKVRFRILLGYLKDAGVNTAMILSAYIAAALIIAATTELEFLIIWLSFVPGGLYEVTLLALVFGFDVAYIAFHHTIRVVMIFLSLPAVILHLNRPSSRSG